MNDEEIIASFYENGIFLDFYKLLEVNVNATEEEIKKNYRRLAKIYHPDSKTGNERKMKQLGIAYQILKKQETRKLYDSYYLDKEKSNSHMTGATYSNPTSTANFNTNSKKAEFNSFNSYFSWNRIRDLLRKCHYPDFKIEGFIHWCQSRHIQISSGSELCSKFSEYNSSLNKAEGFKNRNFSANLNQERNQDLSWNLQRTSMSYCPYDSIFDSMIYRQALVREMILASFINSCYAAPMISNLQFFGFCPTRVTLVPYVPTMRVVFYRKPKIKYYY